MFHKCTKAAISVAIIATTATTGAEIPPIAAPSVENAVLAPAIGAQYLNDSPPSIDTFVFALKLAAATFDIAESKLEAVFTAAVPRAVTPAVTGRSFSPAPEILPSTF